MQSSQMRPLGVTIIAILVALGAVLQIIFALTALGSTPGFAIFSLIIGVLYLGLAWGLWTLRPWAFWSTVVVSAIGLVEAIFGLIGGQGNSVISLIIFVVIFVYLLMDRNVRAAFRT